MESCDASCGTWSASRAGILWMVKHRELQPCGACAGLSIKACSNFSVHPPPVSIASNDDWFLACARFAATSRTRNCWLRRWNCLNDRLKVLLMQVVYHFLSLGEVWRDCCLFRSLLDNLAGYRTWLKYYAYKHCDQVWLGSDKNVLI